MEKKEDSSASKAAYIFMVRDSTFSEGTEANRSSEQIGLLLMQTGITSPLKSSHSGRKTSISVKNEAFGYDS